MTEDKRPTRSLDLKTLEQERPLAPPGDLDRTEPEGVAEDILLALLGRGPVSNKGRREVCSLLDAYRSRLTPDLSAEGLELVLFMSRTVPEHTRALLRFLPDLLAMLPEEATAVAIRAARRVAAVSGMAAYGFLSHFYHIHQALGSAGIGPWVEQGIRLLAKGHRAGEAFFSLATVSGRDSLGVGAQGVSLSEVRGSLRLYAHGLSGRPLAVRSTEDGLTPQAGLLSRIYPSTDGLAIYLPPRVEDYPTRAENVLYYKILCSHQAAYFEAGTFAFSLFEYLRTLARHPLLGRWKPSIRTDGLQDDFMSHIQIFYRLFPAPGLARTIFTLVEDGRVDAHLRFRYPGLKRDMGFFVDDLLARRPPLAESTRLQDLLEVLLRLSLDPDRVRIPDPHLGLSESLRRLLGGCYRPGASVEDAAVAATEIYGLFRRQLESRDKAQADALAAFSLLAQPEEISPSEALSGLRQEGELDADGQNAGSESLSARELGLRIEMRGHTDIGLTQKGLQARQEVREVTSGPAAEGPWQSLSLEELKRLLEQGLEPALSLAPDEDARQGLIFFCEAPRGPHSLLRKRPEEREGDRLRRVWALRRERRRSFRDPEERVFYYDEWDALIAEYRQDWCRLLEKEAIRSRKDFAREVRTVYGPLIASLRRQFEMLRPERYRMERALLDGDDIDLDRTIESIVDRQCGITGSDRLYRERRRTEREVSTLFLLDMSSSTDERVRVPDGQEEGRTAPVFQHASNPVNDTLAHASWAFSAHRGEPVGQPDGGELGPSATKRIIDIEKEALVLMTEALEPLGDRYGIYGFSGAGRMQVEFYAIKEFSERYGTLVKERISGVEPRGSTRMGTALRHCRVKLRKEEARRRNLFLISDGFPQDQDYGESRSSHDYAVEDTARALAELEEDGTHTYCITVDRNGEDYLKRMCPESRYMVIEDIWSLPEALLKLYRKVVGEELGKTS
ncbi:MAG: nitric oxide reductase activation protein NorD [bacterium]